MDDPLISIVVPIYNTAEYLERCVRSILEQTYKNIEVILVNDGSSDQSGEICERLAREDKRLLVIHQSNKGSAAARNIGLRRIRGEWIGWVDSDDWIDPNMYETLMCLCEKEDVKVAVGGWAEEFYNKTVSYECGSEIVLEGESAIYALLADRAMQPSMCNKLWKKELFNNVCFPEGRSCDDIAVSYRLIERARRVGCTAGTYYHYRQHGGSNAHGASLKNSADSFLSAKERYDDLSSRYPQFQALLAVDCLVAIAFFWCDYMGNSRETRQQYEQMAQVMQSFSKQHYHLRREFNTMGHLAKLVLPLTLHRTRASYRIASFFGWLYRKKRGYTQDGK